MGVAAEQVHFVGNPMIDTLVANLDRFDAAALRAQFDLPERYAVATLHRPSNVDEPDQAARIVAMLSELASLIPVIVPLHPRGRPMLEAAGLGRAAPDDRLRISEPLGYIDFLSLVRGAALVVTDSGGIQEETTVLGVPCLTLRANTERPITITHGTNRLAAPEDVGPLARAILKDGVARSKSLPPLWDGRAGERIGDLIAEWLEHRPALTRRTGVPQP
jgi:UDP-N-acetylglucosamine 2-epimerase (non-hydrolysing)